MKEWIKVSIIISSIVLLSSLIDLILSYVAYVNNPSFFIMYEANEEAVQFFHYGVFPTMYILIHIVLVLLFTLFMKIMYKKKDENRQLIIVISVATLLPAFAHVLGGMTWFDTGFLANILLSEITIIADVFLVVWVCLYAIKLFNNIMRCHVCGKVTIFTDGTCSECKEKIIRDELGKKESIGNKGI